MSNLAQRAATLVGGSLTARVLTLALAPIVTRLFTPEAFGEFSAVLAVGMLIGAVCHLRYPGALLLPTEDDDLNGLTLVSLLLTVTTALGVTAALLGYAPTLASMLELNTMPGLVWSIPALVLGIGWLFTLSQLCVRETHFRGLAMSRIAQALGNQGIGITLGLCGITSGLGLMLGRMAALCGALAAVIAALGRQRLLAVFSVPSWKRLLPMAARFKNFPLYAPTALLTQGTAQLPVILLAAMFDPAIAGLYALSLRILREPLNLFGEALSQLFSSRSAELLREGRPQAEFTRQFLDTLLKAALVPLALLAITSVDAFALIFGEKWRQTGTFVTLLSPHYALILLSWPLSALFDIMERLKARLYFDLAFFTLTLSALACGGLYGSPVLAVALFAIASVSITLPRILWLTGLGGVSRKEVLALAGRRGLTASIVVIPTLVAKLASVNTWALLGLAALSAATYFGWLYFTDPDCARFIKQIKKK